MSTMGNWIVVDNFGNVVAGPYSSKQIAESIAAVSNLYTVVYVS